MDTFSSKLYSAEVLEFVKSSNEFCNWLEKIELIDYKSFLQEGLWRLTGLYSRMIAIPPVEPVYNESGEKYVTEEAWSSVYRKIAAILGVNNEFSDIPKTTEFDRSELVTRKISEDIADIYQDIRDFLESFRNSPEEIMNDALWECQSLFENNWGEKLLRISRAMHLQYFSLVAQEGEAGEHKSGESFKNIDTSNWFITKRQKEFGEDSELLSE